MSSSQKQQVLGARLAKFLLVLLPLPLLIDPFGIFGWPSEERQAEARVPDGAQAKAQDQSRTRGAAQIDTNQRDFLLKEYETATRELQSRLEQEHTMLQLEFTLVGAVFGFVLYLRGRATGAGSALPIHSPLVAACCWAAVVVSAIVDIRRQFNVNVMIQLGTFVKAIEGRMLPPEVAGWEQWISETKSLWKSCLYPVLRTERELLTYSLFLLCIFMFKPATRAKDDVFFRLASFFGTVALILFGLYSLQFHYQYGWHFWYCFLVTGLSIASLWGWLFLRPEEDQLSRSGGA